MTLLSLDGVAKRYADTQVLRGITLGIHDGDRIGVIGLNGSGKSTLLRIMAGVSEPDEGRVVTGSMVRIGYVAQEPDLDPDDRVLPAVMGRSRGTAPPSPAVRALGEFERATAALQAAPEDERAHALLESATRLMDAEGGWQLERRAHALLDRLGVSEVHRPISALSGGQRKRVALARGLATEAELLILDEPTNHLDLEAIAWLEDELHARSGALVLVTHDRYLLDRLATRVVEVESGTIHAGLGSYADYLEARARREEQAAAAERRRRNRARTELAWLRRGPRARTSKARYRVRQAREVVEMRPDAEPEDLNLRIPSRRLGSKVVNLHNAGKRYDDRWVLRGIDHRLAPGARIGVVGPNGAGKTTLLAMIAGRVRPDAGKIIAGETVVTGWYGQDPEVLPPTQRVIDAVEEVVREVAIDGPKLTSGQLLERFGFPPALQRSWVGQLSGGERRRLELLRVLGTMPNLLLLDEPTNDLDLDTLGVLEELFDSWPGALMVASHDRYFLDRVCHDLFAIEPDGTVAHHPGGWSAWREAVAAETRSRREHAAAERPPPSRQAPQLGGQRRARKLGYRERRELESLDRRLSHLEERKTTLTMALQHAVDDYETSRAVSEELAEVLAALESAEMRWLELAEIGES
ncbi:MAG: ATP-binding cassette domain-containing protein [Nitriliruptorales bacterium]|nr:ATP-binding cassette domain-containing protein [Nitriliruptorales bacterium]